MSRSKKLSNPFSTGGGGVHFEAHVQAYFVTLMLTGGHAPCLPCWPISEIKLQGKVDGFETDDLIVITENPNNKEQRKLLGQVKHSITITQGSTLFGEVIQAAWNDFNNTKIFTKGKDIVALITGPINATDADNVQWLLNHARHTKTVDEFLRNVSTANFSPSKSEEKLQVIRHHLKAANGGKEVSNDVLYDFLMHFHLLGYDLGNEFGVVLSLLHSHISQFQQQYPQWAWSRVVDIVQTWNQDAGTITPDKLPEDLLEAFKQRAVAQMPAVYKAVQETTSIDWTQHPDATYLALAILIGAWNDKNQYDASVITQLFGIPFDEWLKKSRDFLHQQDSPLQLKNGIWKVVNRSELWNLLASRVLDQNLEIYKSLAVSVLQEPDPVFELPAEDRYAATIHGKVLKYSNVLRAGIAEGLAILGSHPEACRNCSQGKAETICVLTLRELLADADWILWGSLNSLLPTLSEADPGEFLGAVEKALASSPSPFDALFAQEGNGITGRNDLTGLLWALEGLAWDERHLVRVCVALGELATRDPGGQWANRPSNSLATILLPWFPQTLASVDKRKVAVDTLFNESPDIAWNLLIQLLPGMHQTSSGSHKPSWRKAIPDGSDRVTNEEYWQQVSLYAELAVTAASTDTARLSVLIDHLDGLPQPAFDKLLCVLSSEPIFGLPEERRLLLWNHLAKFTNKHRRHSGAKWALPDEQVVRIEQITERLAPKSPFNLYQNIFTDRDFDLFVESGDWEQQREKLDQRRDAAISEIIQQNDIECVIRFAESVASPGQVGYALGNIPDALLEKILLPHFLNELEGPRKALVRGFIWRRHLSKGWEWCDSIDKTGWKPVEIGQFLACLPFVKEAWDRAVEWLQGHEEEYWAQTGANAYQAESDLAIAVEKLISHHRPHAAINCLDRMRHAGQSIDAGQCVRALIAALSSSEPSYSMDGYHIVELIKYLQSEPSVNQEDLFKVEWAYLPLLDGHRGATPRLLENRLANDPEFYCEVIRLVYRSTKEGQPPKEPTEESRTIATNAWRLLHEWRTPPGTDDTGTFCQERFSAWLKEVRTFCAESGHLEVALINLGGVLIHAPADLDGLWMHHTIAAAMNDREAEDMRRGFRTGIYNSRGVHWVDPTGKPERDLAEQFRKKAEDIENAGFQRLAVTLRDLADDYDREAQRITEEHGATRSHSQDHQMGKTEG